MTHRAKLIHANQLRVREVEPNLWVISWNSTSIEGYPVYIYVLVRTTGYVSHQTAYNMGRQAMTDEGYSWPLYANVKTLKDQYEQFVTRDPYQEWEPMTLNYDQERMTLAHEADVAAAQRFAP